MRFERFLEVPKTQGASPAPGLSAVRVRAAGVQLRSIYPKRAAKRGEDCGAEPIQALLARSKNMVISREQCGCAVARYKGLETHGQSFADAITQMIALLRDIAAGGVDPRDVPF